LIEHARGAGDESKADAPDDLLDIAGGNQRKSGKITPW
jgi:hypothetical protein